MDRVKEFLALNMAIQKKFNPLNWIDVTKYEDGTGSILMMVKVQMNFLPKW